MMWFKFLLLGYMFAIGSILANPFSNNGMDSKIVGGFVTTIEENPWQVALLNFGGQSCGGSIIGDRWILSAAHCSG